MSDKIRPRICWLASVELLHLLNRTVCLCDDSSYFEFILFFLFFRLNKARNQAERLGGVEARREK